MKVAYCIGGLPFGGIERWLYDLCLEYMRNGLVRPRVFNISGTGILMPDYEKAGIDMVCISNTEEALKTRRFDTCAALRRKLKEFGPDVIHTVHFSANYHARLASIGLGVPVITHLRNIKRERRWSRRFADKFLSRFTSAYLAVSKAVAGVVQLDHSNGKRPVRVIYNALLPERLNLEPKDLKAEYGIDGMTVIAVGRYVPQKNLDLLIKAMAILRDQGMDISLLLVGEGSERPALEALVKALDLSGRVIFTGFRSDVPAFSRAADIFAMPSDFEGLPIAHLEAMYCGLPGVVSRHVPSLEIASEACLVCRRDPADIAEKIGILARDRELRESMSAKAVEVASRHTMDKYAVELRGIYDDVLAGKDISN